MKKAFIISIILHSLLVGSAFAVINIVDKKNNIDKNVLSMSITFDNGGQGVSAKGIETADADLNIKSTVGKEKQVAEKKEVVKQNKKKLVEKKENKNNKKSVIKKKEVVEEKKIDKDEKNSPRKVSEVASLEQSSLVAKGKQSGTGAGGGTNQGAKKSFGGVDGVFSLKEVDGRPKSLKSIRPSYPEYAKKMRIEGSVTVSFIIDEKGNISNIKVVKASPANVFENSAITAVKGWKFSPATKNGEPVKVGMVVPINFKFDD